MLRGTTVTLYERRQTGIDGLGAPVYEETPVPVRDVLIAPAEGPAVTDSTGLEGRRTAFRLYLPRGDAHDWVGCRVGFYSSTFRVVGGAQQWMPENLPRACRWNKCLEVERYDG